MLKQSGLVFGLALALGCNTGFPVTEPKDDLVDGGLGGEDDLPEGVIHLPFYADDVRFCVQGVGGDYSHGGSSTFYGLDIDTDNSVTEDVFAPVGGLARVQYDTSPNGFGYHVNIDLGDGTYVVIAHLSDIFIVDGEEVAVGQLLAKEGCTGYCTGDHVHVGLSQGDAGLYAQYGASTEVSYIVRDVTDNGQVVTLSADDFVCDLYGGHWYESQLPVACWHPDGTLVKAPASPEVYVVDQDELYWIADEDTFNSLNFSIDQIVAVSEYELDNWFNGLTISSPSEYRAVTDYDGVIWIAYETLDNPYRFIQEVPGVACDEILASWGISDVYEYDDAIGTEILGAYPPAEGYVRLRDGTLVSEVGASDVYVVYEGFALPIADWDTFLLLGFYGRSITSVPSGSLEDLVLDVGSCLSGIGCIDHDLVTTCGAEIDLADLLIHDLDGDGYSEPEDCFDANPDIYPGAVEICSNGIDEDCDGADLECPPEDLDGDGWTVADGDCDDTDAGLNLDDIDSDGFTTCDADCDDIDPFIYPGATELCDGLDDDCNGSVPADEVDLDGDGISGCAGDCNEADAGTNPYAEDVCGNGIDEDCSGSDEPCGPCETDTDGDGIVDCVDNCPIHSNWSQSDFDSDGLGDACDLDIDADGEDNTDDCDDYDAAVYPGAFETCGNGIDEDCNGTDLVCPDLGDDDDDLGDDDDMTPADDNVADDDDDTPVDVDADGYTSLVDCDDANPFVYPGAYEYCDNVDNDCDGDVDEGCYVGDDDDFGDDDLGDDDDVADDDLGDDDVTEEPGDDDVADDDLADDDTTEESIMLLVEASLDDPADYIWLAGELLDESGLPVDGGYWWTSLEYEPNTDYLSYVATVEPGWTFRYSLEHLQNGVTSWSCIAPYPPGVITMDLAASVDGTPILITAIDNYLGGCELFVEVP